MAVRRCQLQACPRQARQARQARQLLAAPAGVLVRRVEVVRRLLEPPAAPRVPEGPPVGVQAAEPLPPRNSAFS